MQTLSLRKRTREQLDPNYIDGTGVYINWFIMGLIVLNVAAVILQTVDAYQAAYGWFFNSFETISVLIFTVEYVCRIWSAIEIGEPYDHPIIGRLRYASQPLLLIDLIAILPFYLLVVGVGLDLLILRALRLIRFLRLFKLVRYSESMQAFGRAFYLKRGELTVAIAGNLILLVISSSLMYFAEHAAQPEAFPSIPGTMWWGIITLTTVGYGDVTPITPIGQVIGSAVAILGIGLFALPASIMASGFIEAASYETGYCPDCGYRIDWSSEGSGTLPEYELGSRVRIDITQESDLGYDYHGVHGVVSSHDVTDDEYEIELEGSDETIMVTRMDLRSPLGGLDN